MTHELSEEFPTFGGAPGISYDKQFDIASDGYNLYVLTVNEHTGTHIDAPLHFLRRRRRGRRNPARTARLPALRRRHPRPRRRGPRHPGHPRRPQGLDRANGPIPDGACVAMNSGWADKVGDLAFRGADSARPGTLHFPGFHIEATTMLLEETGAVAMAVDTLSLDHGPSADFATHYAWLPAGRYGIECLAGLDQMPASGATLMVGAPKVKDGTGGPARIFALV
jgi:kynurenine formamidase